MKGLILIAGYAKRFPGTNQLVSKGILPVFDVPMVQKNYQHFVEAGIHPRDIGVVVGQQTPELIKKCLGDEVTYIYQPEQNGIAEATLLAKDFIGQDKFVMTLGDAYFSHGLVDPIQEFDYSDYDAWTLITWSQYANQYGYVYLKNNKITKIVEKPQFKKRRLPGYHIAGLHGFSPAVFDYIEKQKVGLWGRKWSSDTFTDMLRDGRSVGHSVYKGLFVMIGDPSDLLRASIIESQMKEYVWNK